jgi:glycosyltransferase involved in cell wall biosynthesis
MFYLPGVVKGLDGFWLRNCLLAELRRGRRDRRVDLIDAHFEYPEGVGSVQAARVLGLPVFVTLRGLLTKYLKSPSRRSQCLRALREATGIISVAHSLKRTAEANGIDGSKIRVLPNAVDSQTFAPGPRAEARAALGIGPEETRIVTVGHVQPVKGQVDLVAALALVKARRGLAQLVMIGDDRYDPSYTRMVRDRIAEAGLEAEVSLLGSQPPERVATWLRAADLFVLPTHHEGCCNAVLEALACGTPVVTTPVGDNADYVGEASGFITPVGDVPALAGAIVAALDRPWDRPAIAAPVTARTWDHVAEETVAFFRERLEARSAVAVP